MPKPQPPPFTLPSARPTSRGHQLVPDLREAVWARSGGMCELCAERLPSAGWQCHHRKLRSRGGLDAVSNLLALHPLCHTRVHGHVAWAEQSGFMVPSHGDPAAQPVGLHGETWVLLAPDGSYLPTVAP